MSSNSLSLRCVPVPPFQPRCRNPAPRRFARCKAADFASGSLETSLDKLVEVDSQYHGKIRVFQNQDVRVLTTASQDCEGMHSVTFGEQVASDGLWGAMSILPALVPDGPIGLFGLGSGSIAHCIRCFYPNRDMVGWEIDPQMVEIGRQWMDLGDVEKNGNLVINVGDCFSGDAQVPGGFAGIIVNVYTQNCLNSELTQVETMIDLKNRLARGGRILVNLAGDEETMEEARDALMEAFEGEVMFKYATAGNLIALTGLIPSEKSWQKLPDALTENSENWFGGACEGSGEFDEEEEL
ncbi:hypothetical protein BSKO_03689 [Bryopsis sp. KO-2023]|nr:hypothetical protein BSKO_03689 [Bryopsis sp. KO-2023]